MDRVTNFFARQRVLCQPGLVYHSQMSLACMGLSLLLAILCHVPSTLR